ncbi:hypothetical protein R1sor_024564 [Riccia sorocarpa]|uniref:Uncharacterized protein n=1 Tax=Riccia sorocarpa TaxID=122646 RepID=A0ABD3GRM4_9MARC
MRDNIPVYQVQENYEGEWVLPYGRTVWKRCEPESETNFQVALPPRQDPVAKGLILSGPSIENLALVLHHGEAQEELRARDEIFVGVASARKFANFVLMIDIANGLMLLIRPSDDFECQDSLWVGKATRAVCQVVVDTNFNKVPIQWWRPKHASSKASISDRYSQCIQRNVAWEVDTAYSGSHWIMADACVYAWKSRATKDKVSLPKTMQEIALSVLDRMSPGSEGAIVLVDS